MNNRNKKGFTLMEILVVIAIIAVLVAIAIPVFVGQTENAKRATDLANMRNAFGAAMAEWMSGEDMNKSTIYYFDGVNAVKSRNGIQGYGQSETDASEFTQDLQFTASGQPNTGRRQNYISIQIADDGTSHIQWCGSIGFVGSASDFTHLTPEQKRQIDTELLDAVQAHVRTMSYGELKQLIAEGQLRTETAFGGKTCFKIAYSCIDDDGNIILEKNGFINDTTAKLFEDAGYDITVAEDKRYLFTSSGLNVVTDPNYEVSIWVDVGTNIRNAQDSDIAENAVVYINDNGKGKHEFNHPARAGQ